MSATVERMRPRVGIGFTPFETRADLILRLAARADELWLDRVDVAEGWSHDALVLLSELAHATERVKLGASIISTWGRSPASIALGAAGLQRTSAGRFWLGLGASSPPLAEGLHGMRWDRPLARLRDTLTAVRALLAGERLPNPAPGARPLRLGSLPEVPVPIALAALSPGSIRLAGELADAWSPFLWSRSRLADGRSLLQEGEARAQCCTPTQVSVAVPVALAASEHGARRLAAWWLSAYATRMGPLYPRMLAERFGMDAALAAVVAAAGASRDPDLPAEAEELAEEVTLFGTYDRAREAVAAWFEAGADSVHLVLPPGRPEEELLNIVEVAASASASTVELR